MPVLARTLTLCPFCPSWVKVPPYLETESGSASDADSDTTYRSYHQALRLVERDGDFEQACKVLARWFGMIGMNHAKAAEAETAGGVACDLTFWPMCQREAKTVLAIYRNAGKEKRTAV